MIFKILFYNEKQGGGFSPLMFNKYSGYSYDILVNTMEMNFRILTQGTYLLAHDSYLAHCDQDQFGKRKNILL